MAVYGVTFFVESDDDDGALALVKELRDRVPAGNRFVVSVESFGNKSIASIEKNVTVGEGVVPHHHVGGLAAAK